MARPAVLLGLSLLTSTSCDPLLYTTAEDTAVRYDSGREVSVDTGVSDVPWTETTPSTWTKVWPDDEVVFATRPSDVAPIVWLPCPSGRAGCEVMDTSWNPKEVSIRLSTEPHPQYWIGGKGYVTMQRRLGGELDIGPWEHVVADIQTGKIEFLGRIPLQPRESKTYAVPGLSSRGVSYLVSNQVRTSVVRQAYGSNASVQLLTSVPSTEAQPLWMADTTIVRRLEGAMAEIKGDKLVTCAPAAGDSPFALAGNTVLMMRDFLQLNELKCPTAKPIEIPNKGKRLGGFTVDTTTSPQQILWIQGDFVGEKYLNTELWSAPLVGESVDTSKSRKVGDSRWGALAMIASHGYHATVVGYTEVQITRLSDGKQTIVEVETGRWASQVLALEKDHVWVVTQPNIKKAPRFTGAVRIAWSIP